MNKKLLKLVSIPYLYIVNFFILILFFSYILLFIYNKEIFILQFVVITICLLTLVLKLFYWYESKSFNANYRGDLISNEKEFILKLIIYIFIHITPVFFIFQKFTLIVSAKIISYTLIITLILMIIGMFIERYLLLLNTKEYENHIFEKKL
tara:strand:+ start:291 stop:743 length:453 start_codon:yes stop_codon:yes gene_type:complete